MDIYMSVKQLREALIGLPDDAEVKYQRIEDKYFDSHGWKGELLKFDDGDSEYVKAFSAYMINGVFVINGHY